MSGYRVVFDSTSATLQYPDGRHVPLPMGPVHGGDIITLSVDGNGPVTVTIHDDEHEPLPPGAMGSVLIDP